MYLQALSLPAAVRLLVLRPFGRRGAHSAHSQSHSQSVGLSDRALRAGELGRVDWSRRRAVAAGRSRTS